MKIKKVLSLFLVTSLVLSMAVGCQKVSQSDDGSKVATLDFPNKAIQVVVPYAAGGGTDQIARILEKQIVKQLPKGIAIVNNSAGSNVAGTTEVYQASPDGYKIEFVAVAPLSTTPLFGGTPYTHDSFTPIIKITAIPPVLGVPYDAPYNTIEEFIEYVKANPGKVSYGSGGAKSAGNMGLQPLISAENLDIKHISYDGGSTAITAMLGGHIDAYAGTILEFRSLVESKQAKVLLNLGDTKGWYYKDVPTMTDKGYEGLGDTYYGIIAPPETPKEIVTIIHDAFKSTIEDPETVELLKSLGMEPVYAGPEDFQAEITKCYEMNKEVLTKLGLIK